MAIKSFKSLEDQINILKNRGLIIEDEQLAKDFLLKNNYYRISGYSLTLRKNDRFFKTASFDNIIDIYEFDHELRHILLKYIETIEVTIKSIFAYEFSSEFGPHGYLNSDNFTNKKQYENIIKKSEEQKNRSIKNEAYLKHFVYELNEEIPLWAYVDLFTISDISKLYEITDGNVQRKIAAHYGLMTGKGNQYLGKFLHSITILRNLCAHGSRLYNRLFEQKPSLNKNEKNLLRTNIDGQKDNAHLFSFILLMKRLLTLDDFDSMKKEIEILSQKIPFVNMKYYGFPDEWRNII